MIDESVCEGFSRGNRYKWPDSIFHFSSLRNRQNNDKSKMENS